MNLFQKYGIKEVADVVFYTITTIDDEEFYTPVLYLDTLKVSTLEKQAEKVSATGGLGNKKLITWNFGKEITLNLEDALFSPASMSMIWGGKLNSKLSAYTSAIVKGNIANKYGVQHYSTKAYPSPALTDEEWEIVFAAAQEEGIESGSLLSPANSYLREGNYYESVVAENRVNFMKHYFQRNWNTVGQSSSQEKTNLKNGITLNTMGTGKSYEGRNSSEIVDEITVKKIAFSGDTTRTVVWKTIEADKGSDYGFIIDNVEKSVLSDDKQEIYYMDFSAKILTPWQIATLDRYYGNTTGLKPSYTITNQGKIFEIEEAQKFNNYSGGVATNYYNNYSLDEEIHTLTGRIRVDVTKNSINGDSVNRLQILYPKIDDGELNASFKTIEREMINSVDKILIYSGSTVLNAVQSVLVSGAEQFNSTPAMPQVVLDNILEQINTLEKVGKIETDYHDLEVIDRMEKCIVKSRQGLTINPIKQKDNLFRYYADDRTESYTIFYDAKTMLPLFQIDDNGDIGTQPFTIRKGTVYYKWTRTVKYKEFEEDGILGRTLVIDADTFPDNYRIVGETYIREQKTGKDQRYQFTIFKANVSSDTSITLQADGDPTTFSMQIDVLTPPNDIMMELKEYDVEEDKLEGGFKIVPQSSKYTYTAAMGQLIEEASENNEIY